MKKNDFYLIGGIILLVAISFILMLIFRSEGSKVLVTIDGHEHKTFDLNEDITYEIVQDGEYNILEIKDGYARIVDASCPISCVSSLEEFIMTMRLLHACRIRLLFVCLAVRKMIWTLWLISILNPMI